MEIIGASSGANLKATSEELINLFVKFTVSDCTCRKFLCEMTLKLKTDANLDTF